LLKKKWRPEGKQVIMYIDDGLGIEQDDELCKVVVNQVKCDLINSGVDIICMTYKRSNFPYIKVACVAKHVRI
jgi:hypothetical protein